VVAAQLAAAEGVGASSSGSEQGRSDAALALYAASESVRWWVEGLESGKVNDCLVRERSPTRLAQVDQGEGIPAS